MAQQITDDRQQYTAHVWEVGEAITKGNMNTIENRIVNLSTQSVTDKTAINNIVTDVNGHTSSINDLNTIVGTSANSGLRGEVASLRTSVNNPNGEKAWTQVSGAIAGREAPKDSLDSRFTDAETAISENYTTLDTKIDTTAANITGDLTIAAERVNALETEVRTARVTYGNVYDAGTGLSVSPDTLGQVLKDVDRRIGVADDKASDVSTLINTNRVVSRLSALDNNETLSRNVPQVISELDTAHQSTANAVNGESYHSYDSIDARFEADETTINAHTQSINTLDENKVSKSDVKNDFTSSNTNLPLSANKGKELRDIIGGTYDPYNANVSQRTTVTTAITSAANTAETNAKNYADSQISTAQTGLETRINAIDNPSTGTVHGLDTRVSALETEVDINNVNGSRIDANESAIAILNGNASTTGSVLNTVNTQIAAVVADAPEAFDTLVEIADWIEDHSDTALEMQENISDNADAIDVLDGRMDDAEYAISHTATQEDNTVGLTQRVTALETEMESGRDTYADIDARFDAVESTANAAAVASVVNAALEDIDERLDGIDGGSAISGTVLVTRVSDVEEAISHEKDENDVSDKGGLEQRMDAAESAISHTKDPSDQNDKGGLTERITATETLIDHVKDENDDNDQGGILQRLTAAETAINAQQDMSQLVTQEQLTTALSAKADSSVVSNLSSTVSANSTTVVLDKNKVNFEQDNKTPTTFKTGSPTEKDDYLIQENTNEGKYYYWKWIKTGQDTHVWTLISGAGGGGTGSSSGEFKASLEAITEPDVNVDYFVGDNTNGYLHYRYIDIEGTLTAVLIGANPTNIKRYNIDKSYDSTTQKNYLDLYEFNYGEANASQNIDTETMTPIAHIELPEGGGGGGGGSSATRVIRITPASVTTVQNDDRIYLRFFYSSVDSTGESHEATYTLKYNNGSVIASDKLNSGTNEQQVSVGVWPAAPRPVGFYEIDVTDYCRLGTQTFNLTVTPEGGASIPRNWTIEIKELRLTSTAPTSQIIELGNTIAFPYTPYGAMTKILHVEVDGVEVGTEPIGAAVSGSESEYIIQSPTLAGAHTVSVYLSADLNGEPLTTTPITRDYIWYDAEEPDTIILASPYRYATTNAVANWSAWVSGTTYNVGDKVKINNIGYICKKENDDTTFNADNWTAQVIKAQQYEEIIIPFTVYNSSSSSSTVKYYEGNTLIDTVSVTTSGEFHHTFDTFGAKTLKIEVGNVMLTFNIALTELQVDVAPVTTNLAINFDPSSLTNSSVGRLPTWTYNNQTYHMSVSDNFNWADDVSGGGYKEDIDGKCFVIKAGTWAEFDYKMFKQAVDITDPENPVFTSAVFDKGAEMKITFKVAAVRDASAVWFTNVGNPSLSNPMPIGIQLSAHQGWLKTSAADAAEKQAALENTTASTNSYLYFPYSEEDKIELDISINKTGSGEDFIMSYEDGVPSKAYAYETSEILYQEPNNESVIRIGSPDCDVYIYRLRIYDKGLSTSDILRNFIADGKNITEKVNRYNRNSIYYDSTKPEGQQFTPYKTGSAKLDPQELAKKMPNVKILMLETPTFTKSKKTFVKSSLRCIHAETPSDYKEPLIFPSRGDEDNWFFYDGYHSGQGTTSDNYGQSSRNVDFLFMCDGVNAPTKKKNITGYEGYVSKLIKGENNSVLNPTTKSWTPAVGAEPIECINWKDHDNWKANTQYGVGDKVLQNGRAYECKTDHTSDTTFNASNWTYLGDDYSCKVSLTDTSIPNNYFNLKVNVASSENVNNALFQKRYNDFLSYVYQSPAYKRDNRIKNDMEFVPAILFIRETNTTQDENGNYTAHLEFNDTDWHFYSLGNIGDSKKTDYTRAYDPDDMNEFTVEISDNNTHNSQFQSGVYISNGERIVEEEDSGINSMNYIWDITDEEWNAQRDPTEEEVDTDVVLPNGKVYVNYRHRMLSSEPFDGKHSFEFRYACCGDYRDGDLINKTPGQDDDAQFDINRAVIEAFYEWIVTASDEEFKNELAEWCVPEAVEYFYAYTHFYTMMDNRAKNCFWHFAKTGTHRQVHHTNAALLHVYDELVNGEYVRTEDTEIDPEKTYYTEYAFDLWVYDCDTAAGIDNNGELIFPYGKEDTDYRIAGVSTSGYVFNGAGSIIWRRLSSSFTEEIADIFNRVNEAACFDATNLINEFDKFQNCYPEEMWRLDIERKYIRTFTGKVYDNCKTTDDGGNTKQNTRFLKEMMQGRKKYQRRQWVRDQAIYFGSKYMLNNVRNNTIEMVCYTPDAPLWSSRGFSYIENDVTKYRAFQAGDFTFYTDPQTSETKLYKCITGNTDSTFDITKWAEGVTPDYKLKIVPYQDMYINVAVGNGNLRTPQRAIAGQEYTIDCTANMNETRVYIYAGSYIQAISGLAPFYIGANIFSSAARLKKLDLGTDNPTYHNTNLKSLTILPNMPILEELNIKNCDNLNTPINLSESNNLKKVEAEGSIIPSLSLPPYTSIETLHLPATVNILSLQSARKLTDFYMKNKATGLEDYSSLINMNINDSDYSTNIDWLSIAAAALPSLSTLYLQGLNVASVADITDLEQFLQRKKELEVQYDEQGNLINKLNLSGDITVIGDWSSVEKTTYESIWPITLHVDENNEVTRYKVVYKLPSDVENGRELYSVYLTPPTGSNSVSLGSDPAYVGIIPSSSLTKPSTVSTEYIFGQRNSYGYMAWTGWRKSSASQPIGNNTTIDGDTELVAIFTAKARSYPIKWYLNENDSIPVRTSDAVEYGKSYDGIEPTVYDLKQAGQNTTTIKISGSNCNYGIFRGWQRLPINLDETYLNITQDAFCIYGDWEKGTNVPVSTILNDATLTPRKLLLLSVYNDNLELGSDLIAANDTMDLTLGQDSSVEGTLLIGENSTYIMNDSRTYNPTVSFSSVNNPPPFASNVQPFNSDDGFTIAIDYRFDTAAIKSNWNTGYSVLAGCHERINSSTYQGFSLYYDIVEDAPKFCFGDQTKLATFNTSTYSCTLGDYNNSDMRNIIVLRHPKNSSSIFVYSGIYSSSNILTSLDDAFFEQEIVWSSNASAAKLSFGNVVPDGTSSPLASIRAGLGTIYWAKYWNTDLGKSECTRLAAWSHEKIRFAVEEYPGADRKILNTTSKNIIFNALQLSQYGGPSFSPNSRGNTIGEIQSWEGSLYQEIANKRFFLGLPTIIQSLINKTAGKASAVECQAGQYNGKYSYYTDYDTNDYCFIPSYPEVTNSTGSYYEGEALHGMPWYSAGNTKVVNYVNTSFNFNNPSTYVGYMNLRFPGVPINLGTSANTIYTNYTGSDSVYTKIGSSRIKRGDIFIYQNVAYIYATDDDVRNGAPIINAGSGVFACDAGGWVRGRPWWIRSVLEMDPANNTNSFYFINNYSGDVTGGLPSDDGRTGCWFTYSFGI